jgi:rubrerythrin
MPGNLTTCDYVIMMDPTEEGKVKATCLECGKTFKAANPETCPKCGGVDLEVA